MKIKIFALLVALLFTACDNIPVAKNAPPAEQESHTIRYLAKSIADSGPDVFILEVDGEKLIVVQWSTSIAIMPLEQTK